MTTYGPKGDGVALMSTSHPVDEALIERFAIRAAQGNNGGEWATHYTEDQKQHWRQFVVDLMEAMAVGDISEDAIEDVPVPPAMVNAEIERLTKIMRGSLHPAQQGAWDEAQIRAMAMAVLDAIWGKRPDLDDAEVDAMKARSAWTDDRNND